jgi:hypothetical protein
MLLGSVVISDEMIKEMVGKCNVVRSTKVKKEEFMKMEFWFEEDGYLELVKGDKEKGMLEQKNITKINAVKEVLFLINKDEDDDVVDIVKFMEVFKRMKKGFGVRKKVKKDGKKEEVVNVEEDKKEGEEVNVDDKGEEDEHKDEEEEGLHIKEETPKEEEEEDNEKAKNDEDNELKQQKNESLLHIKDSENEEQEEDDFIIKTKTKKDNNNNNLLNKPIYSIVF